MAAAEGSQSQSRWLCTLRHPLVRTAVPLVIAVIVIVTLHSLASQVKWIDVKSDLIAASPVSLLTALAFTALSFLGISFYDALATNLVSPSRVPFHVAARAD